MLFGREKRQGGVQWLLVGLGNPGSQYEGTRHNTGFYTLDRVAQEAGARVDRFKFKGQCGAGTLAGQKVLCLKPGTFMNLSGQSVCEAMRFYKVPPERTLLLFDDISLPVGKLRIRRKGSDGGHNGMKNIIYLSGSDQFPRIRLGVGDKPAGWDLADWVLSRFTQQEREVLADAAARAVKAAALIVCGQIDKAMNQYN